MAACISFVSRIWRLVNRRKQLEGDVMNTNLNRCLSTLDLILVGLGHMMGSGIYILTGTVMKDVAGPSTLLSYILGAIAALLSGLCYAQFCVNIPKTGTAYNYVYVIAGEVWAFLAAWNLLLEYLISVASVGRSFSSYIDALAKGAISNATQSVVGTVHSNVFGQIDFVAALSIILVFIVIAVGVRSTVNLNNIMASVNTVVILTFVIAAFVIGDSGNFNELHGGFFPYGFGGAFGGAGILFFAYVGFDAIAVASEEAKTPSKSLPIAMCVSITIASVLYSSASLALAYLVPYNEIDIAAPFPDAFHRYKQDAMGQVITVGALVGMVCSLLGQSYVLPRAIYAIADDGLIFSWLRYVNSRTKTPLIAIGVSTFLSALLAMVLEIQALVEMVSIGTLFAMSLMTACLIKLHYLPASECQFEMYPYEEEPTSIDTTDRSIEKQEKPFLNNKNKQNPARIGELKWKVPILSRYNSNKVTSTVICLLFASLTFLAATAITGRQHIATCEWWAVTLLVIFIVSSLIFFIILLCYEYNKSFTKFSIPLVPWMPVLTLFIQISLMMTLQPATWIRLAVWLVIGFIIYFAYGIRHSHAGEGDYNQLNGTVMNHVENENFEKMGAIQNTK